MSFPESGQIWMNGGLVPWSEARIHVASHVVHYGSAVFEGVRCYAAPAGPAVFRLDAHTERLFNSAKIYRMPIPFSQEELNQAVFDTITANGFDACYIRPLVFRGYGQLGVNPTSCPVEVAVLTWTWGKYLGAEAMEQGVDVCVSSWTRIAPNTLPTMAKAAANYMNSQLIKMEAVSLGFTEGIALDADGYVCEGSGENLFLVRKGKLVTPPLASSVLPGITRDSILTLARRLGIPVVEERIPREALYTADELFFTGTAAEVTPIRSVDKIVVGSGRRGPLTEALQGAFFDVVLGRAADEHGWLRYVRAADAAKAAARAAATVA
jgi:branched-chain amino acid aminotransferase